MKKKQKEIFLETEGNSWFDRNHKAVQEREINLQFPIIQGLSKCLDKKAPNGNKQLLEIGCGEGKTLHWIAENFGLQCYGVEPSKKAVELANTKDVQVIRGTADVLDFENKKFDFVVFGFCLYLCDRSDLFQIAKETDRVLKQNGYIIIRDFYSPEPFAQEYHHRSGIFSYKMDYRKLFDWHPDYECFFHEIDKGHAEGFSDDQSKWIATSILRKKSSNE